MTDNNFQMNGTQVNDLAGQSSISGGVPVPNPDAIQEFKVQVGQYDASYGRNGGANVDVVTKSGTNQFHGKAWEYFRNTALNANDYFNNKTNTPRPVLRQNQYGGSIGGPIYLPRKVFGPLGGFNEKKDRLFFFFNYQGTDAASGAAPGERRRTTSRRRRGSGTG